MKIYIHASGVLSRSNGPGLRAVVWLQGCTLGCSGCFNPLTHSITGGVGDDTADLAAWILLRARDIDGLTVSGGEPFQQPDALLDLLERVAPSRLSILVFSGYTLPEIRRQPLGERLLSHIDVLIAGRYVASQHLGFGLLGSANQSIHLLTPRHTLQEFSRIPTGEVILHVDGTATLTGVLPLSLRHD